MIAAGAAATAVRVLAKQVCSHTGVLSQWRDRTDSDHVTVATVIV